MIARQLRQLGNQTYAIGGEQPHHQSRAPRDALQLKVSSLLADFEGGNPLPIARQPVFVAAFRFLLRAATSNAGSRSSNWPSCCATRGPSSTRCSCESPAKFKYLAACVRFFEWQNCRKEITESFAAGVPVKRIICVGARLDAGD